MRCRCMQCRHRTCAAARRTIGVSSWHSFRKAARSSALLCSCRRSNIHRRALWSKSTPFVMHEAKLWRVQNGTMKQSIAMAHNEAGRQKQHACKWLPATHRCRRVCSGKQFARRHPRRPFPTGQALQRQSGEETLAQSAWWCFALLCYVVLLKSTQRSNRARCAACT